MEDVRGPGGACGRRSVLLAAGLTLLAACSSGEERPRIEELRDQLRDARRGDVVTLPQGQELLLNAPLRVPQGVTLRGGQDTSLTASGPMKAMITLESGARVEQVVLDSGGHKVAAAGVLLARDASDVTLAGVTMRGTSMTAGVSAPGSPRRISLEKCLSDGPATGISVVGGVRNLRVADCEIRNWSTRGIYVQLSGATPISDVKIENCSVTGLRKGGPSRYPIVVTGREDLKVKRVSIRACTVKGNGTSYRDKDFPGTADQIAVRHARNVVIADNEVTDGGEVGITLAHSFAAEVRGNTAQRNDTCGIYVGASHGYTMGRVVIEGNTCTDNGQNRMGDRPDHARTGIIVAEGRNVTVRSNTLGDDSGPQLAGVALWGAPESVVGANDWGGQNLKLSKVRRDQGTFNE